MPDSHRSFDRLTVMTKSLLCVVVVLMAAICGAVFAQDNSESDLDEDELELRPGLVAEYVDADGGKCWRVDRMLSFVWGSRGPDPRIAEGKFAARWRGYLKSQTPGRYQLYAYAVGRVKIKLRGKLILDGRADKPAWLAAKPVELPYDWHPLQVELLKTQEEARIALFWSGPRFQLEPVGQRWLFHDPGDAPDGRFERGQLLVRALRCTACHAIPGQRKPPPAPALEKLAGNISRPWLVDWLTGSGHPVKPAGDQPAMAPIRRMPSFGFQRGEAEAIAAFLLNVSLKTDKVKTPIQGKPAQGERLFLERGCLACHRVGELGESGLPGGGDLSGIAAKRPASFFVRWLADPSKVNRHHRMPVFDLSTTERNDLAAYLATLGRPASGQKKSIHQPLAEAFVARGRQLVLHSRCTTCHLLPVQLPTTKVPSAGSLTATSAWLNGCTSGPHAKTRRPGYQLAEVDREAIRHYVSAIRPQRQPAEPALDGHYVLAERNCLACHARGPALGIAAKLPAAVNAHPELSPLLGALTPPPLASVGDKLREEALVSAIRRAADVRRPWLRVRMPKFNLSDQETAALVKYFVNSDRIPEGAPGDHFPADSPVLRGAGSRLVTSDGFGCTSCHQIGKVSPPPGPLAARGADLSLVGKRIRRAWFDRWVRNPARIVPRMEMPSVQVPVRGVLGEKLDDQLAAVWSVLNQPGFSPPRPNAVRLVRTSGTGDSQERAAVLTDVLRGGGKTFIKPLLVGLANRHNVLLDLQTNQLAAWWVGDVARQRTDGKSWYWERAGENLLPVVDDQSDLLLVGDGQPRPPLVIGQFPTELDSFAHVKGGLTLKQRLHFTHGQRERSVLHVRQTFTAIQREGQGGASGFTRRIQVSGIPSGLAVRLRLAVVKEVSGSMPSFHHQTVVIPGAAGTRIHVQSPRTVQHVLNKDGLFIDQLAGANGRAEFQLEYLTDLPVDQYPRRPQPADPPRPVKLDVVPGFEAVRLGITDELMPTGLSWRPDGTLVVTSLKGRVWLARDTDGDQLEDQARPFSDELAAPFGAAAYENYIDVINKYALLRLYDDDNDGRADRTVTLASGWGHTADYHDWSIGLPRDEAGNYYVGAACQQDQRRKAAAHLRGKVFKLLPRQPSRDDPRAYRIEVLTGGHRFPAGIALNRRGDLFVTDNQGNWNPFNELNHVIQGKRYGFYNALERGTDLPAAAIPAAVEIPHPWTRSVNGICFLETPPAVRQRLGRDLFGPFEGHLVGCEYDTRRLIRISLQRVGDTFQGACYPLSRETGKGEQTFLGPITCAVAPDGDLYIGSLRDSGWGAGNNTGTLVRLRLLPGKLTTGIARVLAENDGFTIEFTAPVNVDEASFVSNYAISSYRRTSTAIYGGPDQDRRIEQLLGLDVASDARAVKLRLKEMREGYVYEFHLKNVADNGKKFFPAEAYYTLRRVPR